MKLRFLKLAFVVVALLGCAVASSARSFNDKLLNRPYADLRRWHLGFSVGVHTQNVMFTHNGFVTDDGESWFMEQPSYSPGFCVNGLVSFRLNNYFSVRFTPGMYFGNRDVRMREMNTGAEERQNIKSAYVVLPLDLKYAALRYRNARPYLVGGIMPAFDVTKKNSDIFKFKSADMYLSIGFGCDFYLPYFKLIPELRFSFGLSDILTHDRPELADDPSRLKYTASIAKATSKMISLVFYFE